MYMQLEMTKVEMHQLQAMAELYRDCGLRDMALQTAVNITDLTVKIHHMEEQLGQHLHRLQVPDLKACLSIDADDPLVLSFEIARANFKLIDWFNTKLSANERMLLSHYMGIQKGGVV